MTLREEHRRRTREALANAGLELFLVQGFEATTIDQIAAEAGVSRATAFRYFPSKEDLFYVRQHTRLDELRAALAAGIPAGATAAQRLDLVRDAAMRVAARYQDERAVVFAQERVIRASARLQRFDLHVDAAWARAFEDALAASSAPAERRRAAVQAGALVGAMRAVLRDWFESDGQGDLVERAQEALGWLALTAPEIS
jgi:AcrR family transcriptional regulator